MNLLAHAYLSFEQPSLLVGNMISDYVKGRQQFLYPAAIQKGIALHRAIDHFTDNHAATQSAKAFFRPAYRLYAGACVDVVYDHFLANDSRQFADDTALLHFSALTYRQLSENSLHLPAKFAAMLPYMQQQNWLYHYRFNAGIEKSFGGLVRRAAYLTDSAPAFEAFEKNYTALQQHYDAFFPGVKDFAMKWLQMTE